MKSAQRWSDEFCRKHIINSRENDPVRELVEAVQKEIVIEANNKINELEEQILLLKSHNK